ncbi:MAG: response regulator transcription factor [Bradyrhizobium sp.]
MMPGMAEHGRLIAVVDDDPSVLRALKRLLSAWSYRAETYESARAFLDTLGDGRPDCLIVDLHMPDMTGLELQRHLTRAQIDIPIIVITAHDEEGVRERCRSAGAKALLTKPLQERTLLDAIAKASSKAGSALRP